MSAKKKICFDISTDPVEVPHENDILLGRGGNNNKHIGNEQLRLFAMERVHKYSLGTKKIKSIMVLDLVSLIRNLDPPGRFLRQGTDGLWYEAGNKFAKEKASQVYRDAFVKTLSRRTNDTCSVDQNSNKDDVKDNNEGKQLHVTKPRVQTKSSLSSMSSETSRTYYRRTKKTIEKHTKIHSDEMSNSTLPTESSYTLCKSELEGILTEKSHEDEYEHDYDIPFSSNLNTMDINIDPSTYEINLNTNYNLTKITPEEAFDSILGEEFQLESSNTFFVGETPISNLNAAHPLLPPPSLVSKHHGMFQTESSSALHVLNPEGPSHETDHHNECDYDISYGNHKVMDMNTQSNTISLDKNYDLTHISSEEVFDLFMDEELTLDLKGFHLFM